MLTHLLRMYFPILINWTSLFPGFLDGIFHFIQFLKKNLLFANSGEPDRRRMLRRLIWFCTVLPMSHKKDARLIWVKSIYSILINLCTKYLVICKVYTDAGGNYLHIQVDKPWYNYYSTFKSVEFLKCNLPADEPNIYTDRHKLSIASIVF